MPTEMDGCWHWLGEQKPKKKPVFMMSTGCSPEVTIAKTRSECEKPAVIDVYNKGINGVDISEQLTVILLNCKEDKKMIEEATFLVA